MKFHYEKKKRYRVDLKMWEIRMIIFWIIPYYAYKIWADGKEQQKMTFRIKSRSTKEYISRPHKLPVDYIGKEEFREKYNSNKWILPINRTLNLNIE